MGGLDPGLWLLAAVFAAILEDSFGDNLTRDAIAGFVRRLREDYSGADEFKPLTAEAVIRASAGEVSLFEDLTREDIVTTQIMIIGRLGVQGTSVRPDLDRILDDAEELVAEWEREDQ
ncbi:hypothetical protein [Glycomyces tenuis]|uniref:hypothetical protein n=1 Tax=Glycomyces tenuis TaxID=58116 RepID=UPI000556A4B0|nr:hypothetical protein [Glycomyces tenuis]